MPRQIAVLLAAALSWISPAFAGFLTTAPPRIGPAAYDQTVAIASDGLDYLAAWTTTTPTDSAIYTQRINADGTLVGDLPRAVDPPGSPFAQHHLHPHGLSLIQGRDGYFLSWMSDEGVNGAITDQFGVVERMSTDQHDFPAVPAAASYTRAAWNGSAYLVLSGFVGPFAATLFDNNGNILRAGIPIGDTHGEHSQNQVIADGTGFLVLSTKGVPGGVNLYGRRISGDGTPGEWFLIRSMASNVTGLGAADDGSHDVIVWGDQFGVWTMQLDPQTNAATPARQIAATTMYAIGRVLWSVGKLWISYEANLQGNLVSTIAAVDASGAVSEFTAQDTITGPLDLAANGSSILSARPVGWSYSSITGTDVVGRFIAPQAGSDFVITRSATLQQNGDLAAGGSKVLAVWDEIVPPQREIFGAVVSNDETAAPTDFLISSAGLNSNPATAFNGKDWLVAWSRRDSADQVVTVARRVSADGVVLDSEDIVLGSGNMIKPAVTSNGTDWLVVWMHDTNEAGCGGMSGSSQILGARVSNDGTVLDPGGVAIGSSARRAAYPDVAWNGTNYVAAWSESCQGFHNPSYYWIEAATISPDLRDIRWSNLTPDQPLARVGYDHPQVIATAAGRTLVAWNVVSYPTTSVDFRIFGATLPLHVRSRAAGPIRQEPLQPGVLIGMYADAAGQIAIVTRNTIPWAPAYQGIFRSTIDSNGKPSEPSFRVVLDADERPTGHLLQIGPNVWMSEMRFVPTWGADRVSIRTFN